MNIMVTAHNSLDRQLLGDLDTASPWAAILDQLGLAIAVLNADLGFMRVTRQFAAATGATPDFFLGRQYFEVFPQPVVEAIFRQVRDSGIAHVHTARPFLPKLSPILGISYWNWSLTPFSDGEGAHTRRTQYLVLTMQDVSAPLNSEIRARRGEAELRTLLDHLPGMTYRAAADWSSDILLNCEALTGYTAAEINALPEKWLSLIHPDDVASVVVDCERLRTVAAAGHAQLPHHRPQRQLALDRGSKDLALRRRRQLSGRRRHRCRLGCGHGSRTRPRIQRPAFPQPDRSRV
jgi:PAS domain-containing protein